MKAKFEIERNFLVKTRQEVLVDPKEFLYCDNIEELIDDLGEYFGNHYMEFPTCKYAESSECLGTSYQNIWYIDEFCKFYTEWQRLKGLPKEIL